MTLKELTKTELKARLDVLKVKYKARDTHPDLLGLLEDHLNAIAATAVAEPVQAKPVVVEPTPEIIEVKTEETKPEVKEKKYKAVYVGKSGRKYLLGVYTDKKLIRKDYSRKGGQKLIIEEL
jgi:hypothetical protein